MFDWKLGVFLFSDWNRSRREPQLRAGVDLALNQVQEEEDQVRLQGRAAIPERGQDCPEVRKTEEEDVGPMNTGVDDGSGKIRSNKKHLNFLKF